ERNRQRLRACAFQHPAVTAAPVVLIVLGYHNPHRSHLEPLLDQRIALGALTPEAAAETRARTLRAMERRPDPALWATRAATAAATRLLIAGESRGVASAVLEEFDPGKVKEAFGIPNDHTICTLVALGFAAEESVSAGYLELDEICYLEHFGQPWTLGEP